MSNAGFEKRLSNWRRSVVLVALWVAVLGGEVGCQSADTTRAQMKGLQKQWSDSVVALRTRHESNDARFRGLEAPPPEERSEHASLYQTADTLQSANRQTLNDFDIQVRQAADEVEAAIVQGGPAGPEALDVASTRVAAYLHAEDESVLAATVAIAKFESAGRTANP